jgi:hypothetical protein
MKKNARIQFVKSQIEAGEFTTLDDIFSIISKKEMADFLGQHPTAFTNQKLKDLLGFRMGEILKLAETFEVDCLLICKIIKNTYDKRKQEG